MTDLNSSVMPLNDVNTSMLSGNSSDLGVNLTNYDTENDDYYVYEYDYEDSVNNIPLEELVPVAVVYSLTLLLGVIGNVLVIFSIVRYRRMQNVTNTFLTSLASADLLLVLICVPIKFAKWFSFTWNFGEVLCKGVHYLQNVSVICSVLTLTAMSMERYYAILHPMRAKYTCTVKRARRVCVLIWSLSFILALPIIFGQVHKKVGLIRTGFWCIREWSKPLYSQIYECYMLILILCLPLIIMSFAYISICVELWIVTSKRKQMRSGVSGTEAERENCFVSTSNLVSDKTTVFPRKQKITVDDDATRKQVIKMLVAVIVLFAICWGPTLIDNVMVAFGALSKLHYDYLKYMRQAFVLMSYFNSCVNPIVYAFMSRNFRETFKYALCVCIHGKNYIRHHHYARQVSQAHETSFSMTRTISLKTDFETETNDLRLDGEAYRSYEKDEPL